MRFAVARWSWVEYRGSAPGTNTIRSIGPRMTDAAAPGLAAIADLTRVECGDLLEPPADPLARGDPLVDVLRPPPHGA